MAKGKLNTPWNRFWLLVSVLWMGVSRLTIGLQRTHPPGYTLDHQTSVRRVEAIHNREFLIALGTIGFVLWFLARFVRYGFAFGFKSTAPAPESPAISTH
jgi:hypothetical protein